MSDRGLERVQTARMIAERLEARHLEQYASLLRDPCVARTLTPDGRTPGESVVLAGLDEKIRHWEKHGFGLWLLRDRVDGAMVGRGGLQHTSAAGEDEVEVAWAIVPARWGQGLASELARAAVDAAFDVLELPEIIAYTTPTNLASRRVMEKTGFELEREFSGKGGTQVLYRLRRTSR